MLIDRYMPAFDVRHHHETHVDADPATAYEALRALDLEQSWLVRLLFAIRSLPSRKRDHKPAPRMRSFIDSALAVGWRILEEDPGHEMVVGAVTKPWAASVTFQGLLPQQFVAFSEPGFTKIVWNIAASGSATGGTTISLETRVLATDAKSKRRFLRYWFLVNPGIRLIRRVALARVKRQLRKSVPLLAA